MTVKNSKKHSATLACGTNSTGTVELIAVRPRETVRG
jgi:hypothetical protein